MKPTHICRCCLTESCYKDISNEYFYAGEKEVYSEMLFETFNLNISYREDSKRLICEECIVKLRNAAQFRKQVLLAEGTLEQLKCDDVSLIPKTEVDHTDDFIDHITIDFDDDAGDEHFDDDYPWQVDQVKKTDDEGELFVIKLEPKGEISVDGVDKTRASTKSNKLAKLKVKKEKLNAEGLETKITSIRKGVLDKDKPIKEKPIHKKRKTTTPSQVDTKQNTLHLINNSNMCLFESLKTKFRCFYCKNTYLHIKELREHSETHSNQAYLKMCINRLQGMSYKAVDISSLTCKLCSQPLKDLTELTSHLTEQHNIEFSNGDHLLIPYRLEDGFSCVICSEEFHTFYRLSIHMNSHYANNVCEICGGSYINRISLRMHVHSVHKEKKCTVCSATFISNYTRAKHMRKVHNSKHAIRYCLLCNKTFRYSYLLNEHRIQEHGVKRQISNCIECRKTFLTPQNLRVHIRSVHVRERNYPCVYCSMRFFTKADQKRHERTHEDVRSFACSYCEGRFKSKDSMRRHLKRQHRHLFIDQENIVVNV